jgi:hypothetical protein
VVREDLNSRGAGFLASRQGQTAALAPECGSGQRAMSPARDAVANAIAPYRKSSGEYRLNNKFRHLIARA